MESDDKNNTDTGPTSGDDLWFLPSPAQGRDAASPPWPVSQSEQGFDPAQWLAAEAGQYRALLRAVQALARFGERLRAGPEGMAERFALGTVSALLRGDGIWLGADQIALYRALRIAGDDTAQDLARASWAVRRLSGGSGDGGGDADGPLDGLRAFLGRRVVSHPQQPIGQERPVGDELDELSGKWLADLGGLKDAHPLTRAAFGFALWRALAITPLDQRLEPGIGALMIGAAGQARFLALTQGRLFGAGVGETGAGGGAGAVAVRLAEFYGAAEAGARAALSEMDRLSKWQARAQQSVAGHSGRTPGLLVPLFLRFPVVSVSVALAAQRSGCSRVAVSRNLRLLDHLGLIREVTGQSRYRFWTVRS